MTQIFYDKNKQPLDFTRAYLNPEDEGNRLCIIGPSTYEDGITITYRHKIIVAVGGWAEEEASKLVQSVQSN